MTLTLNITGCSNENWYCVHWCRVACSVHTVSGSVYIYYGNDLTVVDGVDDFLYAAQS